jgi:hypothetical protein
VHNIKNNIFSVRKYKQNESNKFDVFSLKFRPNTFTFVDQLLLIFYNGGSNIKESKSILNIVLL